MFSPDGFPGAGVRPLDGGSLALRGGATGTVPGYGPFGGGEDGNASNAMSGVAAVSRTGTGVG